jgi:hypothetical protein
MVAERELTAARDISTVRVADRTIVPNADLLSRFLLNSVLRATR